DYADKDADVFPFDSEHGTHVAGIIGGQDDTITGIAKNTQLILMKVFPDLDSGAKTDDILTALEDAVLLGVDAINLSLGSACGFTREEDGNKINEVYDKINEAGISLVAAASNDYSSAYGGPEGNTNKVTNPDSATVGSPSTYTTSLSVASISGKKSRYLVANDEQVIFFNESNSINGKANDFFKEIGIEAGGSQTYEYITIPGNGLKVNYTSLGSKVKGKIALVRRGGNTFEEKAALAKAAGAIACIIYNNVEGDILMSMGKSDHIPTISISKEDGTILASKSSGTILLADANQAGPFMSDFSSWGPTSDLKIKPEITAHGGDIYSAVPGGGYDYQSGTSMASPNMCGAIVLLRQHLKEQYPDASHKEISILANQLLMSTATIVLNQQGNPYSPRKQGAGLASLRGAVTTPAYLTVDGIDRTKLELGDDAERTGVYEMEFNVVNLSTSAVEYDLSVLALTESVSTSDDDFVAEKSYMLNGSNKYEVLGENGSISGNRLTVNAGQTAKVKVTYTMGDEDKNYITNAFPYGMFVEGFVTLTADNGGVNLNVPFLSFFGDWTEAPMFDKTYYEVESEAHNGAIDEEDKLKADYYATTPYGSYYYNYIIPLGTYLYDLDTNAYDAIPASEDHIATSNFLGAIDGISCVYAGLLRNAKEMHYTIVDKATGEVVWSYTDHNASKAHYYGGIQFPYYDNLKISSYKLGFVNNREYTFLMSATLDYGNGGVESNARNTFSFDFTMDNEAPVIKEVTYDKEYDKTLKKDRYYINVTVYDNHYAMSIAPILFTSSSSYTFLTDNPIPIYSEKGSDTVVRFEVTDFLEDIEFDELIQSGLAFSVDDYALNANLYICQLPGTKGEFTFTKDGQVGSSELNILTFKEGEVIDMTEYLATKDGTVDADKDYLKHLYWESSKPDVVSVKEGVIKCLKKGSATITVTEQMDLKSASIIIKVSSASSTSTEGAILPDYEDATINKIRFSHYETLFAYSRAAQYSDIGETGDTKFLSASNGISFYPGEKVKLFYDLDPWYAADNYELTFTSTRPEIVSVNENGEITALKKGNAIIQLTVAGSNLMATVNVTVKSEFVIENRQLIAYKGLGGVVEIPDDEGILYIGAYAFCLYETDQTMELPEDDYDANKIPSMNTTITKVIIPEGVEDIQKYAFYNCVGLKEVVIPSSIKYIREYAFYNTALKTVNVQKAKVIGHHCFASCLSLESIEMPEIYAIGARAFEDCENLKEVDLTTLRNTGSEAFKDCTSLTSVVLGEHTKLSYAMFVNSGITQIDIYEREEIPTFCFAQCKNLNRVTLHHDLKTIGYGAFSECTSLTTVNLGKVSVIQEQAFYGDSELAEIALPNCEFTLGNYAFLDCSKLEKVSFGANTKINQVLGNIFQGTAVKTFEVDSGNTYYIAEQNGTLLVNKDSKDTVIFASFALNGEYELDEKYTKIANSAFAGTNITKLTVTNANTKIGEYAFMGAKNLAVVVLPQTSGLEIGAYAFSELEALTTIENLDKVLVVGDYAFAMSAMTNAVVGANAVYGEGVFFESKLVTATIGANAKLGLGVFQRCRDLTTVNMPEEGGVHIGSFCFAYSTQLATIDLSKTDDYIEDGAFIGCTSIKKAELTNVKIVGDYAFADCAALNLVTVPVVEEIGCRAEFHFFALAHM
ncbi:MAG: leucine-rich repeat protein, partial [Clostridia bacterium]|nr:leucine-rich repeat protein [Clostridia bacterium]